MRSRLEQPDGPNTVNFSARESIPERARQLAILCDWFAPGIRAGGPIRSCVNLVRLLKPDSQIQVVTTDRDLGDAKPYSGILSNTRIRWDDAADVFYCGSGLRRLEVTNRLLSALQSKPSACLYLNSMFSPFGTLLPLILWRLRSSSVRLVLAPRGMLKPSALSHRRWKKQPSLSLLRSLHLTGKVVFHATSEDELGEIESAFQGSSAVLVPNVPVTPTSPISSRTKRSGELELAFLGRVHPIKNLHLLLEVLAKVSCKAHLRIIGPEEDRAYLARCQEVINRLPHHVTASFLGALPESEVSKHLNSVDAMALLTEGENFGHAIFEALAAGTPVVISDQTIWKKLNLRKAGWELPLNDCAGFVCAFETLGRMSGEEHLQWRQGARSLAEQFLKDSQLKARYEQLFWPNP